MITQQQAAAELLQRRKDVKKSESLMGFVECAWHVLERKHRLKTGWAIEAVAEHLEAVTDGDINRLLINIPPGMMKSLMVSVFYPAWIWINDPGHKILSTSHVKELATRDNVKFGRLIQDPWFKNRWGEKFNLIKATEEKYENSEFGFRKASAFTKMTGERGDTVVIDDPLSTDDADSEAEREKVVTTFTESLPTRMVDPEGSSIVVIMQRLHERDPSGIIIEQDLGYTHVMLPMEFEPDRKCTTCIGWEDPRTEEGELLFEERFPRYVVERDKRVLSAEGGEYAVAGQMQQRPIPRGGAMFIKPWLQIIEAAPTGTRWCRGWDLAATKDKKAAFTAGVLVGIAPDGRVIIGDATRIQGTAGESKRLIINTASQDGPTVQGSLPQDPGQAGKAQVQDLVAALNGYNYTFSPESGDKITRAEPLAAQAHAGNVYIVRGDWNKEYIDELTSFPRGKFADQVDASTRAHMTLTGPRPEALVLTGRRHR